MYIFEKCCPSHLLPLYIYIYQCAIAIYLDVERALHMLDYTLTPGASILGADIGAQLKGHLYCRRRRRWLSGLKKVGTEENTCVRIQQK